MNKLSLGNLIGGVSSTVVYVIALLLCSIGIATQNRSAVAFGGLMIIFVWAFNLMGIIIGLIAGIHNKKDWKAWVSLGIHAFQFGFSLFLSVLGTIARHSQHTHYME